MGGGGSTTRNITMEEDPDTGMVKVSEDVLRRMLGQEEQPTGFSESDELSPHRIKHIEDKWQSRLNATERKWQERLKTVEDRNANTFEINAEEFKKAAEEVEAKFIKQSHVPICQNLQDEVVKCFTENPTQTLKCSQQVKDFTRCVDQARMSIVTKKSLGS
ncbi:putative MICOS complex subunit Mic19 [Apostichopus japonicus]|uniref:Putative MICOS complex subunit Mic19 n=1 Tax=Stichopus japonicus TaxID=307972 RepID=A0A2G8KHM3_STIJA|nr:putative MICOS complex subunit Mic19 [Apostichopus japonicus]